MSEAVSVSFASAPQVQGKVLLIEDDIQVADWLCQKLQKSGLECTVAHSKAEADAFFLTRSFHAVVTDVFLESDEPKGLEIVKEMFLKGIPSIVISSRADLKLAKDVMNSGASFLLEKPFVAEDLVAALRKIWEEPRGYQGIVERFLDLNRLTTKEKEIVRLLLKGLSNKEVARMSGNTEKTIKFHLTTIFQKCGVESRTELFNAVFPT